MLEEITNIYNEKGITEELINKISEFANLTIKIDQNDPYWSIEAQNILKLLMISNLMNGRILTNNLLNDETSNAESVKNEIVSSLDKLRVITKINNYISSINILNNDKMLKDIIDIIREGLKIESIKPFKIRRRIYSGHCGKGLIFNEIIDFSLSSNQAITKLYIEFWISKKFTGKAALETTIPFIISDEEIVGINKILNEIKNKAKVYDPSVKETIPEYYRHTELKVDDVTYEILSGDENLSKLKLLIKYDFLAQALSKSYKSLIEQYPD